MGYLGRSKRAERAVSIDQKRKPRLSLAATTGRGRTAQRIVRMAAEMGVALAGYAQRGAASC
jgi:16S rRNA U1498 N3-methylase RsmE